MDLSQLHAAAALPPRYPMHTGAESAPRISLNILEKRKNFLPPGNQAPDLSVRSLVTVLSYSGPSTLTMSLATI